VGERIVAPAGEFGSTNGSAYLAGYIDQLNDQTNSNTYNPLAYLDPFVVGFTQASQGAIIPVNAIPGNNTLEVHWFRPDDANLGSANLSQGFARSYWPAVIGHYTIQWPTTYNEIIMANNAGSGPLDSLQAQGTIYSQPNPMLPGYNPNEEHGIMIGG